MLGSIYEKEHLTYVFVGLRYITKKDCQQYPFYFKFYYLYN